MKAINQCEPGFTYVNSNLIFQIPRFMLITNYHVISPLGCIRFGLSSTRGVIKHLE